MPSNLKINPINTKSNQNISFQRRNKEHNTQYKEPNLMLLVVDVDELIKEHDKNQNKGKFFLSMAGISGASALAFSKIEKSTDFATKIAKGANNIGKFFNKKLPEFTADIGENLIKSKAAKSIGIAAGALTLINLGYRLYKNHKISNSN